MAKVLFIVSGATYLVLKDGTRYATGYWAEEFARPYKAVTDTCPAAMVRCRIWHSTPTSAGC